MNSIRGLFIKIKLNRALLYALSFLLTFSILILGLMFWANTNNINALSKLGSQGTEVSLIQKRLKELGYFTQAVDGNYNNETVWAVKNFQSTNGITADGVAGPNTIVRLGIYTYGIGSWRTSDVKIIQQKLNGLGYYASSVDGIYGNGTSGAVQNFQKAKVLTPDGVAGKATLSKMFNIKLASSSSGNTTPPSNDSNYNLLARLISAESRGEPYIGQVAVGAVVMNRVRHPSFPNTIPGVIYQTGAFSCVSNGTLDSVTVPDSCYQAAGEALNGYDPTGGAIYFYNPKTSTSEWIKSRPICFEVGNHVFTL